MKFCAVSFISKWITFVSEEDDILQFVHCTILFEGFSLLSCIVGLVEH